MVPVAAFALYLVAGFLLLRRQLAEGPDASALAGFGPALLLGAAGLALHSLALGGQVALRGGRR